MPSDRWDSRPYLQRAGDSISQLINVLLLNGMPDESVSGRCYRNTTLKSPPVRRWWIPYYLAEALFWYGDRGDHCRLAFLEDLARAEARSKALSECHESVL
jgi:hypothetical protein